MKTRAPALRRAAQKPLPQAPAHATKPAPRRAATIRKRSNADASRMKAADRRRVIQGRSKTLMRHCRIGHRRGSFKEKSYRDRVNAVLESVYGSTFSEGAWWYRNPDEDAFFASVFSMASGQAVTAAQAARVFVKNDETRKIELDETAMRAAGISVADVAALYAKTPAAAWIAETRGEPAAREAIFVPPLEGGEKKATVEPRFASVVTNADVRDRPTSGEVARRSSRATESSASGASETRAERNPRGSEPAGAAEEAEEEEEDDDDATVAADDFDADVDLFLEEAEDAIPALPAGGDPETPETEHDSVGLCVLPDSLGLGDLFASQLPRDAEAPRTTSRRDCFFEEASSPARREKVPETGQDAGFGVDATPALPFERLVTLGAVREKMSFLGAAAASAVSAKAARSELETHLARVDRILREQAPHECSELVFLEGF